MRRPALLIFINAMILVVIFALLTQSLIVVQRLAVAQTVAGRVEVQRAGRGHFRALSLRDAIKTGDIVRCGPDGVAEFKWADGTRWKVMPNTQISVKKSTSHLVKRTDQSQLKLSSGKVFVRIVQTLAPSSKFEVETPGAVAAVRGTIFSVQVAGDKTEVAVFKGQVKVSSTDASQSTTVASGQEAVTSDGGALQTRIDAASQADFQKQTSIIKPELWAELEKSDDGKIVVSGQTEAGDIVTINGEGVKVLGNGAFRRPLNAPAGGIFTITSVDKHGAKTVVTKSLKKTVAVLPAVTQSCSAP